MPFPLRSATAAVALLALAACQRLPPLPTAEISAFAAPVREQLERARQAVAAQPESAEANGHLAMLYHNYRLDQQAIVCYQRAHVLDSANVRWSYLPGLIALRQTRFADAVALLQDALQREPHWDVFRLRLAEALSGAGRSQDAEPLYAQLIQAGAALPYAHLGMGKLLEGQGRLDEAITHLRKAAELAPGYKESHFALGQALRRNGDAVGAEKARRQHQRSDNLTPPIEDPYREKMLALDVSSQGYLRRSVAYDEAGRLDLAMQELHAALRSYPENLNALVNLISLHARSGDTTAAERYFRRALAVNPGSPEAHFYWANTLASQDKPAAAIAALRQTLAGNNDYPGAATLLGDLLAVTQQEAEAEASYRAALRLRQDDPVAGLGLGRILLSRGQAKQALPLLELGRQAPGRAAARAYQALVEACAQLGDSPRREQFLTEAEPLIRSRGSASDVRWLDQQHQHKRH